MNLSSQVCVSLSSPDLYAQAKAGYTRFMPSYYNRLFREAITLPKGPVVESAEERLELYSAGSGTPARAGDYIAPRPNQTTYMKSKVRMLRSVGGAVAAASLLLNSVSHAGLFFWDNAGGDGLFSNAANWNPDGSPGAADLAVNNIGSTTVVNGNWNVDSFRLSDGASVNHTSGTFTIAHGVGPDNGLWVGEFGPGTVSYTLNGGAIQIDDPADGLMVGRSGNAVGVFDFVAGSVTNMLGDTHIGLDGTATWTQSSGIFQGRGSNRPFCQPAGHGNLERDCGCGTWAWCCWRTATVFSIPGTRAQSI